MAELYEINDVEIFATGYHHGKWWTRADLKQIHGNFHKLSFGEDPYFRPTVAVGHEEEQKQLKDSGLLAGGIVAALKYREEGTNDAKLVAKYRDVPAQVKRWHDEKKLLTTSAEVYPDFVDHNGVSHGLTLRRVAMLGAEIPQQKNLKPIPQPVLQHGDGQPTITVLFKFAETVMDREQMVAMLKGMDVGKALSPEFIDSLTDEQLAILLKDLAPKPPEETPPGEPAPEGGQMADQRPTTPVPVPQPQPVPAPGTPAPTPPTPVPPGTPTQVILKYADLEGRHKRLEHRLTVAEQMNRRRLLEEKNQLVAKFCDRMVSEGKLLPAEMDRSVDPKTGQPKNPANVYDRLMRADPVNRVYKFGDKPPMSELELQMAEIEARPVLIKFAERLPDAAAATKYQQARELVKARVAARQPTGKSLEERLGLLKPRSMV